ncbi:DNA-binding response regulator [Humibacillus sp. DSM 29435]|uniref:response regulator transcription factor n=1 Tax=Humibacillus sp. DSM 29435 TaxID=1869167 RepID=UPI0008724C09|nr:response regulator transcription factor [Humibacillus sp. DSM 29435]OFE15650.1 DNA-binding response regulator [Humibacillus sp. DSM 29435]
MSHLLIAEDESRIASFLEKGLRAKGFTTTTVGDGEQAWQHARSGRYDLLVLDLGLPIRDGMWVLRSLRADGSALPVVILTARDTVQDTVTGLQSGADDYLRKPFAFDELLARVRLRLRSAGAAPEPTVLHAGPVALDLRTRRARVAGRSVELTTREFALAEVFMRHPDQVLTREQLLSRVWGLDFDPGSNVIDVYVRYLRRKLGDDRIETVRGAGYRFSID